MIYVIAKSAEQATALYQNGRGWTSVKEARAARGNWEKKYPDKSGDYRIYKMPGCEIVKWKPSTLSD